MGRHFRLGGSPPRSFVPARTRIKRPYSKPKSPCPDLIRASTSFQSASEDVDGRDKHTAVRHASCYSCRRPLELDLRGVLWWSGLGLKQLVDASAMHQIEAHQAGKGERAESAFLRGLGEAQQEEGDEGDGDLNAHGIFAGADELSDLQRLLDPAEEELDGPAPLVEVGDLLRACREIVAEDAQNLASFDPDADLAHRHAKWVLAIVRLPLGQLADAVGQDGPLRRHGARLDHRERRGALG